MTGQWVAAAAPRVTCAVAARVDISLFFQALCEQSSAGRKTGQTKGTQPCIAASLIQLYITKRTGMIATGAKGLCKKHTRPAA